MPYGHIPVLLGAPQSRALPTRWIARSDVTVDRVACPWLIRRFIDPRGEFFFVPGEQLLETARYLVLEFRSRRKSGFYQPLVLARRI
jgi:hypothetical protein